MLRNRSRAVRSKQGLMSDHSTPLLNPTSPISSFLGSPRFFNGFLCKNLNSDTEATTSVMSPTSILDLKNSASFVNPFGYESRNLSKKSSVPTPSPETNSNSPPALGLALIDSIIQEKGNENDGMISFSKPINRTVLFGSKLKVQIPDMNVEIMSSSPKSPGDFGIKTIREGSQLLSPVCCNNYYPARELNRQLSLKEMELSEDYTCVTTHGPNPKTTHIFDDCIVECCCGDDNDFDDGHKGLEESGFDDGNVSASPSSAFLSFCHTCRNVLGQDKDIYMYRGEKAFCSYECRCQEMFLERMANPESDDDAF